MNVFALASVIASVCDDEQMSCASTPHTIDDCKCSSTVKLRGIQNDTDTHLPCFFAAGVLPTSSCCPYQTIAGMAALARKVLLLLPLLLLSCC
jgi:hypothetical protein